MEILYYSYRALGVLMYPFIFVLGLILGSFLNSWIWRVRENLSFVNASRSLCVHCRRQLKWWENIPLFSYWYLKGQCYSCKRSIPHHYVWVELFMAVTFTLLAWYHVRWLPDFLVGRFLRDVFFVTFLAVVFVYDWMYQEVLLRVVWPGAVIGFLFNYYVLGYSVNSMVAGAALAGGFFGLQYLLSRGRWMGGGDVRLGVMIGVWLGWPATIVALFLAYVLGALIAAGLLIFKKGNMKTAVPFGTFLAVGTFLAMFHGEEIINWYLRLINF